MRYEINHADTCLSDYWSGHHLPHYYIPVHNGMTLKAIKEALLSEINEGAVAGSLDYGITDSEQYYKAAKAAVNRMRPSVKGQRRFFTDLEIVGEDDYDNEPVYAYFVLVEIE